MKDAIEKAIKEEFPEFDDVKIDRLTRAVIKGMAPDPHIVHTVGPNGFHKLTVGEKESKWHLPSDLIRVDNVVAATDSFVNLIPQVSVVIPLQNDRDFKTETVQFLPKVGEGTGKIYNPS